MAVKSYSVSLKVNKEEGDVQVAAAIGPEARKVFKTCNLSATERKDIKGVIERFDNYCNPRKNISFERYLFNSRQQEPGASFDRYVTALRQIADKCAFDAITPDDLLRDRIIFGIADDKVRERLLHEPELNLAKTLDICRASEMSQAQQEPGTSFDRYVTALRQITDKCAFDAITSDDLLRDRIIFGIADNKVRERLLREPELILAKTLDICRDSEMSQAQIKAVREFNPPNVHPLKENKKSSEGQPSPANRLRYLCRFCGRKHESKRKACPAGASSVSSAVKRTILLGNAPILLPPIKCHCLRKRTSCLSSKFSKCQLIKARIQVL